MAQGRSRLDVPQVCITLDFTSNGGLTLYQSALDAGVKIRPTEEELKEIGPDFTARWNEYFVNAPDKPVMWMGPVSMFVGPSIFPGHKSCISVGDANILQRSPGSLATGRHLPIVNTSPWVISSNTPHPSDTFTSPPAKMYTPTMTSTRDTSKRPYLIPVVFLQPHLIYELSGITNIVLLFYFVLDLMTLPSSNGDTNALASLLVA